MAKLAGYKLATYQAGDGPSAGLAVTLAIASVLSRRAVRRDLAMTGDVTLRGKALEIGGGGVETEFWPRIFRSGPIAGRIPRLGEVACEREFAFMVQVHHRNAVFFSCRWEEEGVLHAEWLKNASGYKPNIILAR